jgi:XPG I-region
VGRVEQYEYLEAPHQADGQLVKLYYDNRVHAVLSPDGDLLDHGLPFLVRKMDHQKGVVSIGSLLALDWAGEPVACPSLKLFTPEDSPRFHYTCACILGSDFLPGGVRNVGPAKLVQWVAAHPEARAQSHLMAERATKLEKWTSATLNPLTLAVEAMQYEPMTSWRGRHHFTAYLHDEPAQLHLLNQHCRVRESIALRGAPSGRDHCSRGHHLLMGHLQHERHHARQPAAAVHSGTDGAQHA